MSGSTARVPLPVCAFAASPASIQVATAPGTVSAASGPRDGIS